MKGSQSGPTVSAISPDMASSRWTIGLVADGDQLAKAVPDELSVSATTSPRAVGMVILAAGGAPAEASAPTPINADALMVAMSESDLGASEYRPGCATLDQLTQVREHESGDNEP